ncbi:Uma2 family endonuclease [Spirulina sp. 06S082]|uniref:Uma2 family endonuclease n=1 Tax=Spirulina sp. 06S082 TaxID=3110248 RepID=UPI002B20FBA1|nr:Uma2 family endonuclease [Spirulina sp. 06S082]MEA5470535.1 Uma2 family endonuclease [Spirulina sp. 06S082]
MTFSPIAIAPVVKPVSQMQLAPGSIVTIPNMNWQEFEAILQELGEKRSARVAYSQGTLEIMTPLPEYEIPRDLISDIVKILLKHSGLPYQPFGSTTFKREGFAGVEPDACFYIQNYQKMIGVRRLRKDDPPPDLAVEMDVTSKTTLEAYEAIAVPELWIYDRGQLKIYYWENGTYRETENSPILPNFNLTRLIPATVERAWQVGNFQALEELEATI